MAMLITSIVADSVSQFCEQSEAALSGGADMVEMRIDCMARIQPHEWDEVGKRVPAGQWVATNRSRQQGGSSSEPIDSRVIALMDAIRAGAGYVDIEFVDWRQSNTVRHDITRALADRSTADYSPGLILSHHDFEKRPDDLWDVVDAMSQDEYASAVKIAWMPTTATCVVDAFEIMHRGSGDAVAICMGERGVTTRILADKYGGFATYCSMDESSSSAPGQLTLSDMRDRFAWERVDESSDVYGVVGDPVAHSIGPDVFNRYFAATKMNAVYVPFPVSRDDGHIESFLAACRDREWLDIRGLSVTLPHKEAAVVAAGDFVDPPADMIGAVNTLRFEEGDLGACNTDCDAAIDSLLVGMEVDADSLFDLKVDVLGAGGVARAIVAGLVDCGCKVTVFNRDRQRAERLADAMECTVGEWSDRASGEGRVLVNCTSVGMWPMVDESPIDASSLSTYECVFDTVYRPVETKLLRDAVEAGVRTVGGLDMYIRQAGMQLEYWTQQPVDTQLLADIAVGVLDDRVR